MLHTSSRFCCRLLTSFIQKIFQEQNQNVKLFGSRSFSFRNKFKMSNCLDPDHSVGPDLDPDCFQMLSADDKSYC